MCRRGAHFSYCLPLGAEGEGVRKVVGEKRLTILLAFVVADSKLSGFLEGNGR